MQNLQSVLFVSIFGFAFLYLIMVSAIRPFRFWLLSLNFLLAINSFLQILFIQFYQELQVLRIFEYFILPLSFFCFYMYIAKTIANWKISIYEYVGHGTLILFIVVAKCLAVFSRKVLFQQTGEIISDFIAVILLFYIVLIASRVKVGLSYTVKDAIRLEITRWVRWVFILASFSLLVATIFLINGNGVFNYLSFAIAVLLYSVTLEYIQAKPFNFLSFVKKVRKTKRIENTKKAQLLGEKIIAHVNKEKCYLNPNITLKELASELLIHSHILSELLNTHFNKRFQQFINEFRVEKASMDLINTKSTVLQIAYQCGYNSKNSFNIWFKKITGETPTGYRDSRNENL